MELNVARLVASVLMDPHAMLLLESVQMGVHVDITLPMTTRVKLVRMQLPLNLTNS